jgi:hypothetical protein
MLRFMVERMVREGRSEKAITDAVRRAERAEHKEPKARGSVLRLFRPATA